VCNAEGVEEARGVRLGHLSTEHLPSSIHPIFRAPRVLVLFRAAQEVEDLRAVTNRFVDCMRDERVSDRDLLEIGIVAAQVVVDGVVMREAVEHSADTITDM